MKSLARTFALLAWALWLGGLIATFISVLTLFRARPNDLSVFDVAAPRIFHAFEMYQLILATVAIVSTFFWKKPILLLLFSFAAIGSIVSPLVITPQIARLQRLGQTHTPRFAQVHGESMMIYSTDATILLVAGLFIPRAMKLK